MIGIPLSNGKIPLITIQKTQEGREALKQLPLINRFKKELLSGTVNLVQLVASFKHFGSSVDRFYQEYRTLVVLKGQPPYFALKILKNSFSSTRRCAVRLTGSDAEKLRKKLMEGLDQLKELAEEFS